MAANVAEAMDGANLFQSKYFSSGHDQTKTNSSCFLLSFFLSDANGGGQRSCQRCCPRNLFASVFYLWTTTGIRPSPQIAPLVIHLVIHHREVRTVGNGAFGVVLF